ncbi:MAG: hypothetical protein UU34_C0004G0007 [Candidatus Curtissbacteria bacterium GW2011_GWA1_41_11]|uniref:Glycosyltransferase RgtA/B/C/D-like domain-containing protein n=1 Tax=Candidatus Curtissbacteria bacterium GW2011_GWA1_41_11 TaxID=1618409 RepID=A0A0G0UIV9_9BACT|nr:MAG: hypothetical protein UU34_C0004G0007 [Candidatus Curtissbacteria bacterium GW2011_GWA1_41_11]
MPKKETLILLAILFLFFALQYKNFQKNTQSFRFGDESEHLTPAWMMTNYNSKLYKDITTNHQPLPILTSAVFFKITKYQNPFMLIERLRQYMLLISFLGALVLVLKFRLVGLTAVILIETVKFYLFGYHLLAESLALYPVMFLAATVTARLLNKQPKFSSICKNLEVILFGLGTFWVAFSLLPAWPFLLVINIIYFYRLKKEMRFLLIASIILPTILLFMLISPGGWYHYTIMDNIRYFIPQDTETKSWNTYLLVLAYPFQSIVNPSGPIGKYLLILTAIITTAIISTLPNIKSRLPFIFKFALIYLLFVLLNLRITRIDIAFYTAFHILPMLGALTIAAIILFKNSVSLFKKEPAKKIALLFFGALLLTTSLFFNTTWWREDVDKTNEHFIQYGDIESLGFALNIIKLEGDKLLVGQLEGLLNIFSGIPTAGWQNAYLDWSFQSEESTKRLVNLMENTPPTFIYFPPGGLYFNLLTPYLNKKYTQIQRGNGNKTNAYILTSQIDKISKQQWKDYENLYYKIPAQAQAGSN